MIDLSLGKLLMVALIALIVLGPEKLPGAARTAGALFRRVRGGWDNVRAEVERELQMEELRRAAREVTEQANAARSSVDTIVRGVHGPVQSTGAMLERPVAVTSQAIGEAASGAAKASPPAAAPESVGSEKCLEHLS